MACQKASKIFSIPRQTRLFRTGIRSLPLNFNDLRIGAKSGTRTIYATPALRQISAKVGVKMGYLNDRDLLLRAHILNPFLSSRKSPESVLSRGTTYPLNFPKVILFGFGFIRCHF
jgi:hypothetical protein